LLIYFNVKKRCRFYGLVLILASGFFSCSSPSQNTRIEKEDSADLVDTFKLKNENFSKFKVEKAKKNRSFKKSKKVSVVKRPKNKNKNEETEKSISPVIVQEKTDKVVADEWPGQFKIYDDISKLVWSKYQQNIYIGEEFNFKVSFLGITAGNVRLVTNKIVSVAGKSALHFSAYLQSSSYYDFIYKLDDYLHSYVSQDNFLPLKYTLKQRESGQKVDDLQLFDHDKHKTYYFYKRLKKGKTKVVEKEEFIPGLSQDSFSALYFLRGLPMNDGDLYRFPIITRAKMWLLKAEVDGTEEIKVMGKWVKALKIKAETRFPGVLSKKGDIVFYYSNDNVRKLLKFRAKVKIGSVEGELVSYKKGIKL